MNRLLFSAIAFMALLSFNVSHAQVRVLDQNEARELVKHSKEALATIKSASASIETQGRKLNAKEKKQLAENNTRIKILDATIDLLEPYIAGKKLEYNRTNATLVNAAEKIIGRFGDGTMKPRASKITAAELELANQAKLDRESASELAQARANLINEMRELQTHIAEMRAELREANIRSALAAIEAKVAEARASHDEIHSKIVELQANLTKTLQMLKQRELSAERSEKKPAKKGKKGKKAKKSAKKTRAKAISKAQRAAEASYISGLRHKIAQLETSRAGWHVKLLNAEMRYAEMRVHLIKSKLKKTK